MLHKQGFVHVETRLSKTAFALGVNFSSSFESPAVTLLERARLGLGNNWVQLRYQASFQEISASKRARTAVSWEKRVTAGAGLCTQSHKVPCQALSLSSPSEKPPRLSGPVPDPSHSPPGSGGASRLCRSLGWPDLPPANCFAELMNLSQSPASG